MFKFELTPKFQRQYRKLPEPVQDMVDAALQMLAENPSHPSLHTKQYHRLKVYESRINDDYRILWDYKKGSLILLIMVGDHDILKGGY